MIKDEFNNILVNILKNKAMTSSDIKDAILDLYSDENENTIKSMIIRSKLLRSSSPLTYNNGCYAYTLKTNRNYQELFLKLSNEDTDVIKFIRNILNEPYSFISLFTFKKILQISPNNLKLLNSKLEALRYYRNTLSYNELFIYPLQETNHYDKNSDFYINQKKRLLAAKILLYKHNAENLIQIKKAYYMAINGDSFYFPKPLYNIYFDAYAHTPSYVSDLRKPSYVVYDFAINDYYSVIECKSFISRVIKLKAYKVAIIPVCVYKTIKPEVKQLLKSSGIIGIQYSSFLGKGYETILNGLNNISIDDDLSFSPYQFGELIKSIDQINLLEQTKGYLFEYVCYRFLNDYYHTKPTRNVLVPKKEDKPGAQFDMVIYLTDETIVCECKATTAGVGFGILEKANNYTIAHSIDKIKLLEKPNKKMLYIITSYYKKISDENKRIASSLAPTNAPISNESLYTLDMLLTSFHGNEWLRLWNDIDNKK